MSKLKYFLPIVVLSSPGVVIAEPAGLIGHSPDFFACKKAVQNQFQSARRVEVNNTYWVTKRKGSGKRILVNAKYQQQPMRGTCEISRGGRVAEVTVISGRFVDADKPAADIAKVHE